MAPSRLPEPELTNDSFITPKKADNLKIIKKRFENLEFLKAKLEELILVLANPYQQELGLIIIHG